MSSPYCTGSRSGTHRTRCRVHTRDRLRLDDPAIAEQHEPVFDPRRTLPASADLCHWWRSLPLLQRRGERRWQLTVCGDVLDCADAAAVDSYPSEELRTETDPETLVVVVRAAWIACVPWGGTGRRNTSLSPFVLDGGDPGVRSFRRWRTMLSDVIRHGTCLRMPA